MASTQIYIYMAVAAAIAFTGFAIAFRIPARTRPYGYYIAAIAALVCLAAPFLVARFGAEASNTHLKMSLIVAAASLLAVALLSLLAVPPSRNLGLRSSLDFPVPQTASPAMPNVTPGATPNVTPTPQLSPVMVQATQPTSTKSDNLKAAPDSQGENDMDMYPAMDQDVTESNETASQDKSFFEALNAIGSETDIRSEIDQDPASGIVPKPDRAADGHDAATDALAAAYVAHRSASSAVSSRDADAALRAERMMQVESEARNAAESLVQSQRVLINEMRAEIVRHCERIDFLEARNEEQEQALRRSRFIASRAARLARTAAQARAKAETDVARERAAREAKESATKRAVVIARNAIAALSGRERELLNR